MTKVRLPTQVDLKTRGSSTSKDSVIANGFIEESKSGQKFSVKRPGVSLSYGASNGIGNGVFIYGNNLYNWTNNTPLTPKVLVPGLIPGGGFGWGTQLANNTYPDVSLNNPVVAPDPNNGNQDTVFYPRGNPTINTYPPSTGTPGTSNKGPFIWSQTPVVAQSFPSAAAAQTAALNYNPGFVGVLTPVNLGPFLPAGYVYGTSVASPGVNNPPNSYVNAYVVTAFVDYGGNGLGYTHELSYKIPFFF